MMPQIEDNVRGEVCRWAFRTLHTLYGLGLRPQNSDRSWIPEETWQTLRKLAAGEASAGEIEDALDAMEDAGLLEDVIT